MKCEIDVQQLADVYGFPVEVYVETVTGSSFSPTSEALVAELVGGERLVGKQEAHDVIAEHRKNEKIEVRNICKTGYVHFCPSTALGKGRFFDEKAFFDKLNKIDSYVFVDLRKRLTEPLTFYEIPVSKVRELYHDKNSLMGDKAQITKKNFFDTFPYSEYALKP